MYLCPSCPQPTMITFKKITTAVPIRLSSGKLPVLIASTKSLTFSLMLARTVFVEHRVGSFTLSLRLFLLLLKFSVLFARKHSYVSRVLNC